MVGSSVRALVLGIALAAVAPLTMFACATGSGTTDAQSELDPSGPATPLGSSGSSVSSGSSSGYDVPTEPSLSLGPSASSGSSDSSYGDASVAEGGHRSGFTQGEMQKVVNQKCSPCHVGGASGGMSLSGLFTIATIGVASTELPSMKRIEPGKRARSYLFHKIAGTHLIVGGSGVRMPKSGPPYLSPLEVELIGQYIDNL